MPYISVSHKQQGKIVHVGSLYSADMQNFGVKKNSILKGVWGVKSYHQNTHYSIKMNSHIFDSLPLMHSYTVQPITIKLWWVAHTNGKVSSEW